MMLFGGIVCNGLSCCLLLIENWNLGASEEATRPSDTFVGTPFWMAPEVIKQSAYDSKVRITSDCLIMALKVRNGVLCYPAKIWGRGAGNIFLTSRLEVFNDCAAGSCQ